MSGRRLWIGFAALLAALVVLGAGVAQAIPVGGGDDPPPPPPPPTVSSQAALSVVADSDGSGVGNKPGVWADLPGLSTAVYAAAGAGLAATVSAEISTRNTVWLRVLVDGALSAPGDVAFRFDGAEYDGTRTFTFGRENLAAGRHIVQVQWFTNVGTTARVGRRTLAVNTAGAGAARLVHVAAESAWLTKTTQTWENVPNLSRTLTLDGTRDLKITFSGQTTAGTGGFYARALVDGQPTEDVLFDNAGVVGGARSYVFVRKGVGAGSHTVVIQWFADNGSILLSDRAMTVYAAPASAVDGGLTMSAYQGPPDAFPIGSFKTLSNIGGTFTTSSPATNADVTVATELRSTGLTMLRAVIDGQPIGPVFAGASYSVSNFRAQTFSFVAKNLRPGTHTVQVQVQALSGTAFVADRTLAVTFTRRPGADFAQPYRSLAPRKGGVPTVAICFDPRRAGHPAPTLSYLRALHDGNDGGRSVHGWFLENSDGQLNFAAPQFVGCTDGNWLEPPAGRTGTWYWDTGNFPLMWQDALKAADPFVNFKSFDLNGDNVLTGDEVAVEIIRPQNDPYGTNRVASAKVDGVNMDVTVLDLYLPAATDSSTRVTTVGLISHEASHLLLGTADMYWDADTRPNRNSIMDDHTGATHLDPFHKLKSGFVTPKLVEVNGWSTGTVSLGAVETSREVTIVYDPARNDREYFILENRWAGNDNFDVRLPRFGIVVWHIVEDIATQDQFPPPFRGDKPASGDWGRKGVRRIGILSSNGASLTLQYADGSPAGIRVTAKANAPQQFLDTEIAKV